MFKRFSLLFISILSIIISVFGIASSSWFFSNKLENSEASATNDESIPFICYNANTNKKYRTIEKALFEATSGQFVITIPPTGNNYHSKDNPVPSTEKVTYTISKNCEIKSGVTFIIPTDEATIQGINSSSTLDTYLTSMSDRANYDLGGSYGAFATSNQQKYLRTTIEIKDGVKLTNNGTLVVSGYLSCGTSGISAIGQTSHSYSRILLGNNSSIVQGDSAAITYCYGYISEKTANNNSYVNFDNGTLYIPFIVNDYRGFSYSWALTDGAISTYRASAFNQFEFRNIDCLTTIKYQAKVYGKVSVYVKYDSASVEKVFPKTLSFVGSDSSFAFQLTDSVYSKIEYKYNVNNNIADVKIYGGLTLNSIALKLKESIVTVDLSTSTSFFPFSYRQHIELYKDPSQSSATFNATNQRMKFLPGSYFKINEGCTLNASEISIYTSFYDGKLGDHPSSANAYDSCKYPLKKGAVFIVADGASLTATSIGGNLFSNDNNTINYTNDTVTINEAWRYGGSGSFNPAWNIKDYLEIKEKLSIVPTSYIDFATPLYVGLNTFMNYESYLPSISIVGDTFNHVVDTYQKVLFIDGLDSYQIELNKNISYVYNNTTLYKKDAIVTYNGNTPFVCGINSNIDITSNNNGVNEFDVQNVTVECTTPLVDGNIPLYVGSTVSLNAIVDNINKTYEKDITWSSSNTNIATVDSNGQVTGVSLGTVTITATVDGVVGSIELSVIEAQEIEKISSIYIDDGQGGTSETFADSNNTYHGGKYDSGTDVTFKVNIVPSSAPYASIVWTFTASAVGRQYVNDKTQRINTVNNEESIIVHVVGESGNSDDLFTVVCEVTGLDGKKFEATFIGCHKATSCLLQDSKVTLYDGSIKLAKDLTPNDELLTYNHFTGKFEKQRLIANVAFEEELHTIIKLKFSNGNVMKVATGHGLFNVTNNKYEIYYGDEFKEHIGEEFVAINSNGNNHNLEKTTLVSVNVTKERVVKLTPVTEYNINCIADGMLNIPDDIEGFFDAFEYGGLNDNLRINQEAFSKYVDLYGVYDYEDVRNVIPEYLFNVLNFKYFKVFIGMGVLSYEKVNYWIDSYAKQMCDYHNITWDWENRERLSPLN